LKDKSKKKGRNMHGFAVRLPLGWRARTIHRFQNMANCILLMDAGHCQEAIANLTLTTWVEVPCIGIFAENSLEVTARQLRLVWQLVFPKSTSFSYELL